MKNDRPSSRHPGRAFTVVLALVLAGCGSTSINLAARGISVRWRADAHTVTAYVYNYGHDSSGPFWVYFDANESPVSFQGRPQVRERVTGLGPHEAVAVSADFAPVASDHNAHLGRVTDLVIRVDAKAEVTETNEADNTLPAALPAAAGADTVHAPLLTSTGYASMETAQSVGQTFFVPEPALLVGFELALARHTAAFSQPLTIALQQGASELVTVQIDGATLPLEGSAVHAPLSGLVTGPGYVDLHASPIGVTPGIEYTLTVSTASDATFNVGIDFDGYEGVSSSNATALPQADAALKLLLVQP